QINKAHAFIDSGADLIIGSHPHVIQSKEKYRDKWIYYSLGNFIFDQYFQDNVTCGAMITFKFQPSLISLSNERFITLEKNGISSLSNCKDQIDEIVNL